MGALEEVGEWSGDDGQGNSVFWGDRGAWQPVYGTECFCPSPLTSPELRFVGWFFFFPLKSCLAAWAWALCKPGRKGQPQSGGCVAFCRKQSLKSQMQGQHSSLSSAVIYLLLHALQHDQLRSLVGTVGLRHLPEFVFCGNPVALGCEWLPACGTEPASRDACGRG